jgi:hypothetical protein
LIRIKIGQDLTIDLDDRCEGLPAQLDHFLACGAITGHVESFKFNSVFLQPILRLVAPSTIRLYEQPHSIRFHPERMSPTRPHLATGVRIRAGNVTIHNPSILRPLACLGYEMRTTLVAVDGWRDGLASSCSITLAFRTQVVVPQGTNHNPGSEWADWFSHDHTCLLSQTTKRMSKCSKLLFPTLLASVLAALSTQAAAPATAQQMITGKGFFGISGTAVANLTNNAKFPNSPDALFFFPYFEWNATGDITTPPGNFADNYGGQIVGYFHPPATGDYTFYLAADDNAQLFLSTDSSPANKKLIAQETVWSNFREYTISGGASDLTAKDSSQFAGTQWTKDPATGLAKITLQANQAYYIEALFKEGGGGDNLSVAVADPGFTIDSTAPIPGQYLSTDRTFGAASITTQPQSQTVPERGSVTFRVSPDGTPPYSFQWRRNGTDIPDATNLTFTVTSATMADNNANYSVVVTGGQGSVTSQNATLTVAPDTALPTVLSAKASPSRTEVTLTFSEPIDPATGNAVANYQISSAAGPLNVTGASVSPGGTQVTLTTAQQTMGTKYTILVSGIRDTAAIPNTIAPNSRVIFLPTGAVVEQNGMIVIEAENWDRNTDDIWVRDTIRGTPSGGASVVAPNGAGGNETGTKLEYDVQFAGSGTYYVWMRASGDNGNDDSVWFHIDADGDGTTERPPERDPASGAGANSASMTGFQPQTDFVWTRDSQDGPDPYTVEIPAPGPRIIALARREDGSFIDKIILTTSSTFTPTGFGPPETRQGAPGLPTVSVTSPTAGQTFPSGGNINITATAAGQAGLNITRIQYTANGNVIGESSTAPFSITWSNVTAGVHAIRAVAFDEIGQSTTSGSVVVTVGTPPPQALLVANPIAPLIASDAAVKARLETNGWQVTVVQAIASTTADADGKQLIVISSSVGSGDVNTKFRDVAVPVLTWEGALQDDFLMTLNTDGTDRGTATGQTQLNIVNASHPLAAGLSAGVKTVTTAPADFSWGAPNSNAVVVATIAGNPAQAGIYGYDKDALLIDGTSRARARRVMVFLSNDAYVVLNDDGKKLIDAAIQWASGIGPKAPKTSANIAWVSFHTGDNTPSAAAATAGFTRAADVGYTDLLKSAGHTVTRVRTSGTPDTAVLNAYDLVIISRSVPSGDYQDAAETLAWNGITAPMMLLGGYANRASRLGIMTGSTIPDTIAPVKLTVTDTNHPIFAGVAFDANKTMVNDYANIMEFNAVTQRGISVVTEPPATGATVLATGFAGDPPQEGTFIAELPAGTTLANAAADTLLGDRLVFLTGSRENDGLTSEGAGIFDLTADGAKMFLNAVNYMAGVQGGGPTPDRPTLSLARAANGTITITFTGTLQSSATVTGGWTDETATGSLVVTPNQPRRFYRSKR